MLRTSLLVVAAGVCIAGLVLLAGGSAHGLPMALWGGVLLCAVLVERWRYRPQGRGRGAWQATTERFIDPQSGQAMQVQFNADTGERRYVPDDGARPR